ncbi:MAG: tyrosine-type recombinase/integrase [Anaeroplasmataceae bacterium]|nr:tyrosine-type recombinase/integrase [Anaeroplasmataceae bacterium]
MNIDVNQLLKSILDSTEIKSLALRDSMKIFLQPYSLENHNTWDYYRRKLIKVVTFFEDIGVTRTNQITSSVIQEYVGFRIRHVKPSTLNKEVCALGTMLNYLAELELIPKPDYKFQKFKEDDVLRTFLNPDQVELLYDYVAGQSLRKQVIIRLMVETGVRRTEITRIQLRNISLDEGFIYLSNLQTKAKKGRYLFLLPETKELIIDYLKQYNPTVYLLEATKTKAMTPSAITSVLERIKKDLNLSDLSPHVLRRTFGTLMLNSGANIMCVKDLLGHSTLAQTMKYCLTTKKQLQTESIKYNPMYYSLKKKDA